MTYDLKAQTGMKSCVRNPSEKKTGNEILRLKCASRVTKVHELRRMLPNDLRSRELFMVDEAGV